MIEIKRNTTPTLEITVEAPLELVKRLEFVFKRQIDAGAPELVKKEYSSINGSVIPVKEGSDNSTEFTVLVKLNADETMKLTSGEVYMDTRIVFVDGDIPNTEVVPVNINETLFGEVYSDDKGASEGPEA